MGICLPPLGRPGSIGKKGRAATRRDAIAAWLRQHGEGTVYEIAPPGQADAVRNVLQNNRQYFERTGKVVATSGRPAPVWRLRR